MHLECAHAARARQKAGGALWRSAVWKRVPPPSLSRGPSDALPKSSELKYAVSLKSYLLGRFWEGCLHPTVVESFCASENPELSCNFVSSTDFEGSVLGGKSSSLKLAEMSWHAARCVLETHTNYQHLATLSAMSTDRLCNRCPLPI